MGERKEGRHPGSRKRHGVEGVPADERELAELDLRPRIAETLHDLRHGGDLRLVAPLPGGVEGERGGEIVEPVAVERRDRANGLVAPIALRC